MPSLLATSDGMSALCWPEQSGVVRFQDGSCLSPLAVLNFETLPTGMLASPAE